MPDYLIMNKIRKKIGKVLVKQNGHLEGSPLLSQNFVVTFYKEFKTYSIVLPFLKNGHKNKTEHMA